MIRKGSSSKKSKTKQKNPKTIKSKANKKSKADKKIELYSCKICEKDKDKKNYKTTKPKQMESHLRNSHSIENEKGLDIGTFFEMLRVVGTVSVLLTVGGFVGLKLLETDTKVAEKTGVSIKEGLENTIDEQISTSSKDVAGDIQ